MLKPPEELAEEAIADNWHDEWPAVYREAIVKNIAILIRARDEAVKEACASSAERGAANRCIRHSRSEKGACGIEIAQAIRALRLEG